jgi:hypothetical protein
LVIGERSVILLDFNRISLLKEADHFGLQNSLVSDLVIHEPSTFPSINHLKSDDNLIRAKANAALDEAKSQIPEQLEIALALILHNEAV